jgi:hypothetical protein
VMSNKLIIVSRHRLKDRARFRRHEFHKPMSP